MQKTVCTDKKYLFVPVSRDQEKFDVEIGYDDDFMKVQIPACIPEKADYTVCYPLPGKEKSITADEKFFSFLRFGDKPSERKDMRNQVFHLTAEYGWINDPNGLYFKDGVWHAFFQYNPFFANWGNMHWNHAVSRDLLHWNEQKITLYPDKNGFMFSGSAVIDKQNLAGFGKDAVLLYYTNANYTGKGTQELAYSTDGGRTFRKYEKNPLIETLTGCLDRDPAPVFSPEENLWYMPLFLGDESKEFALFLSQDLLHWEKCDTYRMEGGAECPGLRRMKDESDGKTKWVFTEAACHYRVAEIHHGKITFQTDERKFLHGTAYAGQFFHNAPEGKEIFLAWITMPECPFRMWQGSLSLPLAYTLKANTLYVKPYAVPERCEKIATPVGPYEAVLKTADSAQVCLKFGDKKIDFPGSFTELRVFADRATVEIFDDAHTFALCLFVPEPQKMTAEGFDEVSFYSIK